MVKVCDKFVKVRNAGFKELKFHHCKIEESFLTVYSFACLVYMIETTQSNYREIGISPFLEGKEDRHLVLLT